MSSDVGTGRNRLKVLKSNIFWKEKGKINWECEMKNKIIG